MRLLADENFPRPAILALLQADHDVVCVADRSLGASDAEILSWAIQEDRIVLTLDKDFGELSERIEATSRCGIILLRDPVPPKLEIGRSIIEILNSRNDWAGNLSVVEGSRVRLRPLKIRP